MQGIILLLGLDILHLPKEGINPSNENTKNLTGAELILFNN